MKKFALIIIITLAFFKVSGQSVQEVQGKINHYLELIENYGNNKADDYDSLHAVNHQFFNYLQEVCTNNIPILKGNFGQLEYDKLRIVTSQDGNVRVFFGIRKKEVRSEHTMPYYNTLMEKA